MWLSAGGVNSGHFKDCINDNICNRLYRINHSRVNAGR